MIDNRPPMEATGDVTARRSDRTLLLSPGRGILMEEEVVTPLKGGRPVPETQGADKGKICHTASVSRDGGVLSCTGAGKEFNTWTEESPWQ